MIKIAIVSQMSEEHRDEILSIANNKIEFLDSSKNRDLLGNKGKDIEIVYGNVRPFELPLLPNLKWIQTTWAGIENILYPEMIDKRILITNVRGQRATAMSEHAVASLLYLLRDLKAHDIAQSKRNFWIDTNCAMLSESKVLILGTGAIGNILAKILSGFDAEIYGVNSDGRKETYCKECFTLQNVSEILPIIDSIICCLPATKQTNGFINKNFFNNLKPEAALINISRGSVINENDLIEALDNNKLRGAVLDVTNPEPPIETSTLWKHPKILLTGHNSGNPRGDKGKDAFGVFKHNLKCYLDGFKENMLNVVDYDKGY